MKEIILKPNFYINIYKNAKSIGYIIILKGKDFNVAIFNSFNNNRKVKLKNNETLDTLLKNEFFCTNNMNAYVYDYEEGKEVYDGTNQVIMSKESIEEALKIPRGTLKII